MRGNRKITIAIDGHSSCGKSTLAKALAKKLAYIYVDSGSMYRAVTLHLLQGGCNIQDTEVVKTALTTIHIDFVLDSELGLLTRLNGEVVESEIRGMEVSKRVSDVAAISSVRRFLVAQQQAFGVNKGIVMDGRDIGTVVFPDAELKLFLTASHEERTKRRLLELQQKGLNPTWQEVSENLRLRDHIDSTRADSPLKIADNAVLLDNTHLTQEQQLETVLDMVNALLNEPL